jgi:predicted lipopolysaccharide heptosyltransferase III
VIDLGGKKVLIIKLRYIGDTLSLIPVIDNLKERVPGVIVDVMVNKGTEEVLASHPGVTKIWAYDRYLAKKNIISSIYYHITLIKHLISSHYDCVIDFSHGDRAAFLSFMTTAPYRVTYGKSSFFSRFLMNRFVRSDPFNHHIVDYQLQALKLFGIDHFGNEIRLPLPAPVQARIDNVLSGLGVTMNSFNVAIHPGARGRLRQWPPERFSEIARRLRSSYSAAIILIGGPGEKALVEAVEGYMGFPASFKSNGLSLTEMGALFSRCHLFIGNDSAPAHIAAAVGCPTLTLFGPTFPHMWRPLSSVGEVVFKDVPCCGCRQESCIRPEKTCMELIEVDEVWRKAKAMRSLVAF